MLVATRTAPATAMAGMELSGAAAECGARGIVGVPCTGPATKRCGLCGAVAYCSADHQIAHWRYHEEECARLREQMKRVEIIREFPFSFLGEASLQEARCSTLMNMGLHQVGLWKHECNCETVVNYGQQSWAYGSWDLSSSSCP